MKIQRKLYQYAMGASALLFTLSGCAGSSMMWPTSPPAAPAVSAADKPMPRAQDCLMIGTGTPPKYICNGKPYTGNELRKMREEGATSTAAK
jgi:hypothetical protein